MVFLLVELLRQLSNLSTKNHELDHLDHTQNRILGEECVYVDPKSAETIDDVLEVVLCAKGNAFLNLDILSANVSHRGLNYD